MTWEKYDGKFWALIVRMSPHGLARWLALILIDFYQRHDKVIHLSFLLKPSSSHRRLQQDERLIHIPLLTGQQFNFIIVFIFNKTK